jgi:hypothetical protein
MGKEGISLEFNLQSICGRGWVAAGDQGWQPGPRWAMIGLIIPTRNGSLFLQRKEDVIRFLTGEITKSDQDNPNESMRLSR